MAPRSALRRQIAEAALGATEGTGSLLVVRGEAGIGKTTLVESVVADVADRLRVIWSWCEPLTASVPLVPLTDFERALGGDFSEEPGRHDRFRRVLDALTEVPTAVVVEDLHWADDATLDLVVYLARRLRTRSACLVLTHRDDEPSAKPRTREVLASLAGLGQVVTVPPLDLEEVSAVVAGSGVNAATALQVTGGNAFFAVELARSGGRVPTSVQEAVASRLSQLPAPTRALLEHLSAIPDGAPIDLICAASGADETALEPAEQARLIEVHDANAAFRHDLAREAVALGLPGSRRIRLHRALLQAYLDRPGTPEAVLAFHADHAGDHSRAVDYGVRAAGLSTQAGAHAEAAVQLERAACHAAEVPAVDAARVHAHLGRALSRIGRTEEAIRSAQHSRQLWLQVGNLEEAAVQASRLSRLEASRGDLRASHLLEKEALRLGEQVPGGAGQIEALTNSAISRMLDRDLARAMDIAGEAIALAQLNGDAANEGLALNALGSAAILAGEPDRGQTALRQAIELGERIDDEELTSIAQVNLGSGLGEMRHYTVARSVLRDCVAWCRDRDLDQTEHYALTWLARIDFETGRWDEAMRVAYLVDDPFAIVRIGAATVMARVAVRRNEATAGTLLDRARAEADVTGALQRRWPVLAGECEFRWRENAGPPSDLADLFTQAEHARHPWAVGELGYWLVRFELMAPAEPRLAIAAAPYAAALRDDHSAAADAWRELGCPYEEALANAELSDHARLTEAVAALDRLGARTDADLVAAKLRAHGGTLRRARRSTSAHPAGLTPRETDVLAVLRTGATDAEIAERLHISVKTVGHHVSSILTKLGVPNRRAAAAWKNPGET